MTARPNNFTWYDISTTDTAAAQAFYEAVIGWTSADSGLEGHYTIFSAGEAMVGGLMEVPAEARAAGARPSWYGYIGVDDVDGYAQKVVDAGGAIHHPPEDIKGVGRFSVVADPQGAHFILFHLASADSSVPVADGSTGHIGWHELYAADLDGAFDFYSKLFGWTKTESFDMGPMGNYQLFAAGGPDIGGMMKKPEESPHAFWLYYVNVDALDAAMSTVAAHGGKILRDAMEVPGGLWVTQAMDPQGAMFALVAPKR